MDEKLQCVKCDEPCVASRAGDLLLGACPHGELRYVLTLPAPGEAAAGEDPLVGRTLAPCRIEARLGWEAGLPIYQGVDLMLGREYCVRVLSGPAAGDKAQLQAFVRGAKLAAAAHHPALAGVTQLSRFEGGVFTLAPPLEGQTFGQAVRAAGRMGLPDALRMARRLADALGALHKRQIVHRNVGPASVFILPDGEPVLRNLAFAVGPDAPAAAGEVAGQPGFLAPEQVLGGELDGRADLYSLGALLYMAVVGRPPFEGVSPADAIRSQLAGPGAARAALAAAAPTELVDLVTRLLAEVPEERPADAREVLEALATVPERAAAAVEASAPVLTLDEGDLSLAADSPSKPVPTPKPAAPAAAPMLNLDEEKLALVDPTPPPAKRPGAAAKPVGRAKEPARGGQDAFAPPAEELLDEERQRMRLRPSLELGPREGEKPAATGPKLKAPSASLGAGPSASLGAGPSASARAGPARAPAPAPAPAPGAAQPASEEASELLLETDKPSAQAKPSDAAAIVLPDSETKGKLLTPNAIKLLVVAALVLGGFILWRFVLSGGGSGTDTQATVEKKDRPSPRPTKKGRHAAPPKAESEEQAELNAIEALTKRGLRDAEEAVKRCDAFLARYAGSEHTEAVTKLRESALAAIANKEVEAAFRNLQTALRDRTKLYAKRLAEADAFIQKYPSTESAAQMQKLRDALAAEAEATADKAAAAEKPKVDKAVKAEAYGAAIALLTALGETYAGTKAGADAAAQAAELSGMLAADFKKKKEAAEELLRRAAFQDALAQFDAPLSQWQSTEHKREAAALVEAIRQRRGRIVEGYGPALADFDKLAAAWKLDEARAAATQAAAKAGDPVLKQLLASKAAEAAAILRVRQRALDGAKAEQAKAAKADGKVWLQRATGARLRATIDNLSLEGLDADMPGFKGHLTWADLHADQMVAFARSAPAEAAAADHAACGLLALRAGAVQTAASEFERAVGLDPAATDTVMAYLRGHAQGFVYVPPGKFLAGPKKEPRELDAYLLARAEVTVGEYALFARLNKARVPPEAKGARDDLPVAGLLWAEADAYAHWLDMRLPADLEWERAARGTEGRLYPWGDTFEPGRANLAKPGAKGAPTPAPLVSAYRQPARRDDSPFLHLCGNVREWTATAAARDPKGVPLLYQVVGGSAADTETAALAHARSPRKADARDPYTGFRLAWPR
ncbi:MAG: hypothetical protein FJ291_22940 [Planctomycetes bacterium]|nr:hypothetical protein [Planctomycetota bacterium]